MRATEIGPDLFERQAAALRVEEAIERTEARVVSRPDESWAIDQLTDYAYKVAAARYVDCGRRTFTADHLGGECSRMGIPKAGKEGENVRRRLISVCVNRGRREGRWTCVGKVRGLAGRDIAEWQCVPNWKPTP